MENINKTLIEKLNVNQWKNTDMVIHWFKSIEQKPKCFFIQFDVIEFYPSITGKTSEDVIVFAKQHVKIAEKDLRIIKHCRKSLLYHENEAWKKKITGISGIYWNLNFIAAFKSYTTRRQWLRTE